MPSNQRVWSRRGALRLGGATLVGGLGGCTSRGGEEISSENAIETETEPHTETETSTAEPTADAWSMFQYDERNSGYNPDASEIEGEVDQLWETTVEVQSDQRVGPSAPVIADGALFIRDGKGALQAFELATGEKRWSFDSTIYPDGDWLYSTPAIAGEIIYVAGLIGKLFAINKSTGNEEWAGDIQRITSSSPTIADNAVFVNNSYVFAFEAETGDRRWLNSYVSDSTVESTPAVANGLVYVGAFGQLIAYDISTGDEVWKFPENLKSYQMFTSPSLDEDTVYVGESLYSGTGLFALDKQSGEEKWRARRASSENGAVTVTDDTIFTDRYALDKADGSVKWESDIVYRNPVVIGDTLYAGSEEGTLYAIHPEDGAEKWSYEVGASIMVSPAMADRVLVVVAKDGTILALS